MVQGSEERVEISSSSKRGGWAEKAYKNSARVKHLKGGEIPGRDGATEDRKTEKMSCSSTLTPTDQEGMGENN